MRTALPLSMHDRAGTVRAGGPDAPAPAGVIAQATVELPMNFGMHARIDVSVGRELGRYATIEEARAGAHSLVGADLPSVGIVASAGEEAFRAVELLVPDLQAAPFGRTSGGRPGDPSLPGWDRVRPTPLRMGSDAARGNRFIEQLTALDRTGAEHIVEVALPGTARLEFEYTGRQRLSRLTFG